MSGCLAAGAIITGSAPAARLEEVCFRWGGKEGERPAGVGTVGSSGFLGRRAGNAWWGAPAAGGAEEDLAATSQWWREIATPRSRMQRGAAR